MPLLRSTPAPGPTPEAPRERSSATFERVLVAVGAQFDRGEGLIRGVVSGGAGPMSAAELIALQAGIYRYTELVDLTSKFVDRAANAVRTTLQSGS
ncbi:MAG TPA: hypothetical protein VFU02_19690 [Polyangiaceae bacterium]|nr:hypothetical protein [Polyangiaceae bacterium]